MAHPAGWCLVKHNRLVRRVDMLRHLEHNQRVILLRNLVAWEVISVVAEGTAIAHRLREMGHGLLIVLHCCQVRVFLPGD